MEECVEENVGVRYHDTLLLSHLYICFLNVRPREVSWLVPLLSTPPSTCPITIHHQGIYQNFKTWFHLRFRPRFLMRYKCLENWTISLPSLRLSNGLPSSSWLSFYPRFNCEPIPCPGGCQCCKYSC